jgi:glucose/arabinose dehydrogenase
MMESVRKSWIVITLFAASACGSSPPPAPSPGPGTGNAQSITGRERIGWTQAAGSVSELATLQYAIYVDGARSVMTETSCATTTSSDGYACSGKLPTMSNGSHSLELAAFVDAGDGDIVQGARSPALAVSVSALTAPQGADWTARETATADGLRLRVDRLAQGLDRPVDAAFAPDGRLFIAQRGGRIRLFAEGQLQSQDALTPVAGEREAGVETLSLAIDPEFERTHFIFVVQTAQSDRGNVFRLSRYRELRGRLAERAVLFEAEAPATPASAVSRFGPDGKLYLAANGGVAQGRLFRLAADGTLPRDQAGTTPAIAAGVEDARGLGWDPVSGLMWIADESVERAHVSGLTLSAPPIRAVVRGRDTIDAGIRSMKFYTSDAIPEMRNEALLASAEGYILRLRFATDDPTHIERSSRLLENAVGPIHVVTVSPDGSIYFCTDDSLGKMTALR